MLTVTTSYCVLLPANWENRLSISYQDHLWKEKEIKSVANITRKDVSEFLQIASEIPIIPEVEVYPF